MHNTQSRQTFLAEPNNEVPIEWLAGFFEGEGNIQGVKDYQHPLKNGNPRTSISAKVETINKDEPMRFRDFFGFGSFYELEGKGENRSTTYRWAIYSTREVGIFLERIKPHLWGVKKQQAELALEYLKLPSYHGSAIEPAKMTLRKLEYVDKIQNLTQ